MPFSTSPKQEQVVISCKIQKGKKKPNPTSITPSSSSKTPKTWVLQILSKKSLKLCTKWHPNQYIAFEMSHKEVAAVLEIMNKTDLIVNT